MIDLAQRKCEACNAGMPRLTAEQIGQGLQQLQGWEHREGEIRKRFSFKNYYQTMAFVNAVAWIAHAEDHHPDLEVSYNTCTVRYSTHAIGGVSDNDLICAAKVDRLLQ
jgi:4a-hydroxytetrahydrobiopterin dehydratase